MILNTIPFNKGVDMAAMATLPKVVAV